MTTHGAVGRVRVYLQVIFVGLTSAFGEGSAVTTVCFFLCVIRRALLFLSFPVFSCLSFSVAQHSRGGTLLLDGGRRTTTRRPNEIKRKEEKTGGDELCLALARAGTF
jgi:hypothetical protein